MRLHLASSFTNELEISLHFPRSPSGARWVFITPLALGIDQRIYCYCTRPPLRDGVPSLHPQLYKQTKEIIINLQGAFSLFRGFINELKALLLLCRDALKSMGLLSYPSLINGQKTLLLLRKRAFHHTPGFTNGQKALRPVQKIVRSSHAPVRQWHLLVFYYRYFSLAKEKYLKLERM